MAPISAPSQAACAYDVLAPYYDDFTAGYAYERWMGAIEDRAAALGLGGRRALDLACGTGKSTAQLIARGYSVLACDISPGMIAQAQSRYPEHADRFLVADMRDLPELGEFDLILCLDDAVNYLLSGGRTRRGILVRGTPARPLRDLCLRRQFPADLPHDVLTGHGERRRRSPARLEGGERADVRAGRGRRSHRGDLRQPARWPVGAQIDAPRAAPPPARDDPLGAGLSRTGVRGVRAAPGGAARGWFRRRVPHQACLLRSACVCVPPGREVIWMRTVGP